MKKVLSKILNIFLDIVIILVLIVSILVVTMSLTSKSGGVPNIFGYAPLNVLTDSMEPEFYAGDLIFAKVADKSDTYEVGDIVSFKQDVDNDGVEDVNTHRIIKIEPTENGALQYITTKGDNAPEQDGSVKLSSDILAKYTGKKISGLGSFIGFIRTQTGFFLCILLPMILFFVYEAIRVVLNIIAYNKEKAVQAVAETVANSELTEEQKQRAIEEYLAQQQLQGAETAQEGNSEVQTPAPDEAAAPEPAAGETAEAGTAPAEPDEE